MSNFQFNRFASVHFEGETGVVDIFELRVGFKVVKTYMGFPSQATIYLYNLNTEFMKAVVSKRYSKVTLNAGYIGNDTTLFAGEIKNARITRQGVDTVFTIYATDSGRAWERSTFSKTYDTGVAIRLMLQDLISSMEGVTEGDINAADGFPQKEVEVFSGASHKSMQRLAEDYNFDWTINNGVLDIAVRQRVLEPDNIVIVSAATGMIGSPTTTEIGVDVKVLMNPFMIPFRQLEVTGVRIFDIKMGNLFFRDGLPSTVNGLFKMREVIHKGDTRALDWYTEVVAVDVNREARRVRVGN